MKSPPILIYLPAAKALTKELDQQHNISGLFPVRSFREVQIGPSGPGLIVGSMGTDVDLLTYSAEKQRWSPRFGCNSLIGTWTDLPSPGPDSLAKPTDAQLPGSRIQLLDGNHWLIPTLRMWHDDDPPIYSIRLPRILQQNPQSGELELGRVIPTYEQIWKRSLQVFDSLWSPSGSVKSGQLADQDAKRFALELLQINYWIDSSVISHLGLMSVEHCGQIIAAAFDMEGFGGILKNLHSRSQSSGTNSDSGS